VAAPGVDIVAPAPNVAYQVSTGTSIAAAHVSGVVALLLSLEPTLTPDAVRKLLLSTAIDLGPKGRDDQFGAGLADAYHAICFA
jgi:subtilisin family serine protease